MYGIQGSRELDEFLTKNGKLPVLTDRQIAQLIPRAKAGDRRAKDKILRHNVRLVAKVVGRYSRSRKTHHLSADDLMQEGLDGLLHSIQKFEPERGFKFSTYAMNWIDQRIRRAYDNHDMSIRQPVHIREHLRRFYRIKDEVEQDRGETISVDEAWEEVLKRHPKTSVETFGALKRGVVGGVKSLNEALAMGNDGSATFHKDKTLGETIVDPSAEVEVEQADLPYGQEILDEALRVLPERQERIMRLRYGFMHEEDYYRTYEEVGKIMGLTRERVRQIILQATIALRREYRRRGYEMDANLPDTVAKAQKGNRKRNAA